ncbi:RNA polymerase sigma factor [Roseinatronobacter alkalisoli]|uniref:RNA polymerase sigma factor n=1 Tax=Roseinatronobacter alkalisoli TaxID=3028235 RepID=A0ABT5T381_9RHOB|nr:RNA polymerase sigma factor [Roseinatronobacter sp. HJB301]MDD7969578.1 RNA polymerase sigma factor [Roseinatronobacter sp. HJB301]
MVPRDMDAASEDADLLMQFAQGDRQAAQILTDRLAPRILRFAARMLGDRTEAEDVTQDTMLRLWRIAPDWQDTGIPPAAWVFRVAANLCTDRLRRRRSGPSEMPDLPDGTPGADTRMMQTTRAAALETALAALPERQRQAVILRHLEGLSNPEIAAIMLVGTEAVESLTARGKRNLAALLSGHKERLGYEDEH